MPGRGQDFARRFDRESAPAPQAKARAALYNPLVVNVEILAVGNEILLGLVQDTNSNYLCRVVRGMGGRVRRIAIVRDEIDEIAGSIRASLERDTDVIFTCGGLGPTDDDLTLAAVAKAAGSTLRLSGEARDLVAARYERLAALGHVSNGQMNEARLKMAHLPAGAGAIENPVGAAPASLLVHGNTRIISLPGVPAELKAIVEGPLQTILGEIFGSGCYRERELVVDCGDESLLAPALGEVARVYPEVYIKSRASRFGPDVKFRILLSASATTSEQANRMIEAAASELLRVLRESDIHQS